MNWDQFFINMAEHVSTKSKDPSTKVGCVIVGPDNEVRSTGFNGFPRGVEEMVAVPAIAHFPREFEYNLLERHIDVKCTCGEELQVPQENWDNGVQHEHFTGPPLAPEWILSERWERPQKYDWVEHAERNAIYNAARMGTPMKGCRAYLNWEPHPCLDCTKAFIQAGIIEVIGPSTPFPANRDWKFELGRTLMDEAGVTYRAVEDANKDTA